MKRVIGLIGVIVGLAGVGSAQTDSQRIDFLETLHGLAAMCGNGMVNPSVGEQCDDGNVLDGDGCSSTCQTEPPPPPPQVCGNNVREGIEECDGTDLAGQTCVTKGFDSGTLTCDSGCLFDTSACVTNPPPPPPPSGVYDLLAQQLPPPGEMRKISGSDNVQGNVLTSTNEFAYCGDLSCFASYNSFLAWVGMAFIEQTGEWWNPAGGGHGDYGGNEPYRYRFSSLAWDRVRIPTPFDGPSIPFSGGTCRLQSQLPYSAHTYDGATYIDSTNEIVLFMSVPRCIGHGVGPSDGGLAVYSLTTDQWRLIYQPSFSAPAAERTRFSMSAYDAARNKLYQHPQNGYWSEFDPTNNYARTQIGTNGNALYANNWGVAEFNETTRHLYWTDWGYGVYRVSISPTGVWGTKQQLAFSSQWVAAGSPLAMAIHKPTGDLVFWGSQGKVYRAKPDAGTWENLTVTTGALPLVSNNVIYSKWIYISAVDAFVGVNDPREGVWVYRLPGAPAPPPPPPPPPVSGNFSERCAAEGVVLCDPLDTEGPFDGAGNVLRNPDGTTGIPTSTWWRKWRGVSCAEGNCTLPRLDTTVKASGTGSMKLTYPSLSGSGHGGTFATNFSPDYSVQFGEGDTFYLQYRWRADCNFIYTDCETRTTRRGYPSLGSGTTAAKLSILSTGDNPNQGDWSQGSCTWLELVTFHGYDHALQGYHSCGWYAGFDVGMEEWVQGQRNFQFEPGGEFDCRLFPDPAVNRVREWGYTGPNCAQLEADEWITVQMMVRIGRWQPDASGPPSSRVTMWMAREGQPQRIVIDRDVYLRGPESPNERYGKIWLLPFMTSKDPSVSHPDANIWYDELIVSRSFIADPA